MIRGHRWNRQRVFDRSTCWKRTQNPDHWETFRQQQRPILDLPDQCGGSGLQFICNPEAWVEATGWGSVNYPNQDWGWGIFDATIIANVAWGDSVDPRPDYFLHSPVNPRATQHRVRDNFFRFRCQECLWRQYNRHNTLVNTRVHRRDDNRDGPVTQYSFSEFLLLMWVTVSFLLLLWVTVSGLRARSPCESIMVAVFDL